MLNKLKINKTCISCDSCRIYCPENSILTNGKDYAIETSSCTLCGICIELCPSDSIKEVIEEEILK